MCGIQPVKSVVTGTVTIDRCYEEDRYYLSINAGANE